MGSQKKKKTTLLDIKESIFKRNNLPFVLIIWYHKDAEFTYAREKITALC
jgi:hypothetical protein